MELPFIRIRDEAVPPANGAESEWPWHRVSGPWLFEFEVDVDGGTTIVPDVAAEANGLTVRVLRVIAASNVVRVEVRIENGGDGEAWWPHAEIRHAGVDLNVVSGSLERTACSSS